MILILHNDIQVTKIEDLANKTIIDISKKNSIQKTLLELAKNNYDEFLIWCREELRTILDEDSLKNIFHHKLIMASYGLSSYLPEEIGYVEESPFIKVKRNVTYPTWQMSSEVGGIHASVLLEFRDLPLKDDFSYYLNSLAKLGQPRGLFCYSEPRLTTGLIPGSRTTASISVLFRFVKQHYKTRWLFLLLLDFIVYQRRLPLLPFLYSFSFRKRTEISPDLSKIQVESSKKVMSEESLDVVIPTIGRKDYLYQVLQDLKSQTRRPSQVIIVEQNPDLNSISELDYLDQEDWPFKIRHIFTHQAGVCNARNLALKEVRSEWVFFNDDDNSFNSNLIEEVFCNIRKYGISCYCTPYLKPDEDPEFDLVTQTTTFGAGNTFLKNSSREGIKFAPELEFGYGEDKDFGMQLREKGVDVIFFPKPAIIHLNAPSGGFRIKQKFPWRNSQPTPIPSPTLMWYKERHLSREQLLGYKTVLFFNLLKKGRIKESLKFNSSWQASMNWAGKL